VADPPETTDRRARRTRKGLRDAFVALVLERGYDRLTIEDITERADVARPTFYAHFAHKEDLLTSVFTELIEDLATRLSFDSGPWTIVRTTLVEELYRHASEFRDLYRVCLSGAGEGRARQAYFAVVAQAAERNYVHRMTTLGTAPRVPVDVMARAAAGIHLALLESWLDGTLDYELEELVRLQLNLLVAGISWGQGMSMEEVQLALAPDEDGGGPASGSS
jgi:AcrR family transcriptional regulator